MPHMESNKLGLVHSTSTLRWHRQVSSLGEKQPPPAQSWSLPREALGSVGAEEGREALRNLRPFDGEKRPRALSRQKTPLGKPSSALPAALLVGQAWKGAGHKQPLRLLPSSDQCQLLQWLVYVRSLSQGHVLSNSEEGLFHSAHPSPAHLPAMCWPGPHLAAAVD